MRLAERGPGGTGLRLLGASGLIARVTEMRHLPPEPDLSIGMRRGGVTLRCVGSQYLISNAHFQVELRRQGGVLRRLRAGSNVLAENQDFYGDQAYFTPQPNARIDASSDVECAASVWAEADGFRLRFEGQLRGADRFALKRPPLWYRNEYVFTSAPRFTQRWAFRTERTFHNQKAFLSFFVGQVDAERFRFERAGQTLTEGPLVAGGAARQGQTQGPPDTAVFGRSGKPSWSLTGLKVPTGADVHGFLQGHKLFLPLLDGAESSLQDNHWQEFEGTWDVAHCSPAKDESIDADFLRLAEEFADCCWRPRCCGGEFDFGDKADFRRSLDLFLQMAAKRYSRMRPCTPAINRQQFAWRSIFYRLRAKIDVRSISEEEVRATGWDRSSYT